MNHNQTGFIQAIWSKIQRTFQGFLKDFPTVFKDQNLMKNTDLHVKILLRKCYSALLKILVLEN